MKRVNKVLCILLFLLPVLFIICILTGSVAIDPAMVFDAILGRENVPSVTRFIIVQSRLPQALTAVLAGSALATSGLLLQSAFRNPLAGPGIFGISSGAGLAVAIVMLGASSLGIQLPEVSILIAAFVGAMIVTAIILLVATVVRNNTMLLIIGIMIGYLAGSAITLLDFYASEQSLKLYTVWGMGSFSGVSMSDMPLFAFLCICGIVIAQFLAKPLNAMQLGPQYAFSLGINIRASRFLLLLVTGLLVAVTTAWCGPVTFIGLAVPHITRLACRSGNHRLLLPVNALCGASVGLLCCILCTLPITTGIVPLNAVTPLIGAPVIIYILIHR